MRLMQPDPTVLNFDGTKYTALHHLKFIIHTRYRVYVML